MKKRNLVIIAAALAVMILAVAAFALAKTGWNSFLKETIKERNLQMLYARTPKTVELQDYLQEMNMQFIGSETDTSDFMNAGTVYPADFDGDGSEELLLPLNDGSSGSYTTTILKITNGQYTLYGTSDGYILPVKYQGKYHYVGIERDFDTKFLNSVSEYTLEGSSLVKKNTYGLSYSYDTKKLPKDMSDYVDSAFFNGLRTYQFSGTDAVKSISQPDFPAYQLELVDSQNQKTFRFDFALQMSSVTYSPSRWSFEASDNFTITFPGIEQLETAFDTDKSVLFGLRFFKDQTGQVYLLKVSYPYFTTEPYRNGVLDVQLYRFGKDAVEEVKKAVLSPTVKLTKEEAVVSGEGDTESKTGISTPNTDDNAG